jgi:hypothetical protein
MLLIRGINDEMKKDVTFSKGMTSFIIFLDGDCRRKNMV